MVAARITDGDNPVTNAKIQSAITDITVNINLPLLMRFKKLKKKARKP
jgi:hypothetical protein